jgi:phosphatidylglycerophosphate synthase
LTHVIGTLILVSYTPFNSTAPSWALFLYGLSVFIYQTLDNVDGKQARKLKNSTPLGMIMDHGCDALGLLFLTVGLGRVLRYDNFEMILTIFTIGVSFSFYISAWCQYYSDGIMILGKFNAVDDGIPGVWLCAIVTAFLGQ